MKKLGSYLVIISLLLTALTTTGFAQTITQDEITVTLTTDKEEYSKDEEIKASLTITNNGSVEITNVISHISATEGYVLSENSSSTNRIDSLAAGEENTVDTNYTTSTYDEPSTDDETSDTVQTGYKSNIAILVIALFVSGIGIPLLLKSKKAKKYIALFLCVTMLSTAIPFVGIQSVSAETTTETKTIEVSKNVLVDGEEVEIKAVVSYDIPVENSQTTDDELTVSVDWSTQISETTSASYGLNTFKIFNSEVSTNESYQENMEYMNIGFIRQHSAEIMNDSSATNGWIDYANECWDEEKILEALAGAEELDATAIQCIPSWPDWMDVDDDGLLDEDMYDDFAEFCAELVYIINITGEYNVEYWEPTNEKDNEYYVNVATSEREETFMELITIYNMAVEAMKEVDPTIKTGGLSFARGDLTDMVEMFVEETVEAGTLDFLSYHFYAVGDASATYEEIFNRASSSLVNHTSDIRDILDEYSPDTYIPLFVDEFNIFWAWDISADGMITYQAGVFDALCLIYANLSGADVTTVWNDIDGVYGKMSSSYELRTPADVYQMFNNYVIGDVVSSSSSDESKIVSFAIDNEEHQSIVIVNRTELPEGVSIGFENFTGDLGETVYIHQTSETGYQIQEATWADVLGGNYYVPAYSVTIITNSQEMPTILPDEIDKIVTTENSSLTGELKVTVDSNHLSFEGNLGWMHTTIDGNNVKADADREFTYSQIGDGALSSAYFWGEVSYFDGTDPVTEDNGEYGISTSQVGDGFEFDVDIEPGEETVYVCWGADYGTATITATLEDGTTYSETVDTSTVWENNYQTITKLDLSVDEATTLNIKITLDSAYSTGTSTVKVLSVSIGNDEAGSATLFAEEASVSSTVNLTEVGSYDWVFLGGDGLVNGEPSVERKDTDTQYISDIELIGDPDFVERTTASSKSYSWTDGTTTSATSASNGVTFGDQDNKGTGVSFEIPIETTEAMALSVYLGAYGGGGTLYVSIEDSEGNLLAMPQSIGVRNSSGSIDVVEKIVFQTDVEGAVLKVQYTYTTYDWQDCVWISAIALGEADVEGPSAPTNVTAEKVGSDYVVLSWDASTDDGEVTAYQIYLSNTLAVTLDADITSYYLKGLTADTDYDIRVIAKDSYGNLSDYSDTLKVTTDSTENVYVANTDTDDSDSTTDGDTTTGGTTTEDTLIIDSYSTSSHNLTEEGTLAWVHFGAGISSSQPDSNKINYQADSTMAITGEFIGTGSTSNKWTWYKLSYTDGDGVATATEYPYGSTKSRVNDGFKVTAEVGAGEKEVIVRWGGNSSTVTMTATLYDGDDKVLVTDSTTATFSGDQYKISSINIDTDVEDAYLVITVILDDGTSATLQAVTFSGEYTENTTQDFVAVNTLATSQVDLKAGAYNLSEIGTTDWVYISSVEDSNLVTERKNTDTSYISDISLIDGTELSAKTNNNYSFMWDDGTTTENQTGTSDTVSFTTGSASTGCIFTVDASEDEMVLDIYAAGANGYTYNLIFTLIDKDGNVLEESQSQFISQNSNVDIQAVFSSNAEGAKLKVECSKAGLVGQVVHQFAQ